MPPPFLALDAAICAIQGESDLHVVLPALRDRTWARIVALAPGPCPVVRAVAAICGELTAALDESDIADPALHDTLAHLIGTQEMRKVFWWWARIAPAGWGRSHLDALVDGVRSGMYDQGAIAALIGPSDDAAALLTEANAIAFAIRRWGATDPDAPTAWMDALSAGERNRLLNAIRRAPFAAAHCLPWLPPSMTDQMQLQKHDNTEAINAFVGASPCARAHHANLVQRLIAHAPPSHLSELTRLACAITSDEVGMLAFAPAHAKPFVGHRGFAARVRRLVARAHLRLFGDLAHRTCRIESGEIWDRAQTLIHESPDDAWRVVIAAPWDALAETVRDAILEHAGQSNVCAAIAAAQGRTVVRPIMREHAKVFFAALDPRVWNALEPDSQRRWLHTLWEGDTHLAVRSLGVRPEFLSRAKIDNNLVHAVARHAPDPITLRWELFPVVLRRSSLSIARALITASPTPPPDPGAFFCVVSGYADPSKIASVCTTLDDRSALALALTLQRSIVESIIETHDGPAALAALALTAVRSDDVDVQDAGLNVLVMRPDLVRTIWDALPCWAQKTLRDLPALADLSITHARSDERSMR